MKKKIFLAIIIIATIVALLMIPKLGLWNSVEDAPKSEPSHPEKNSGTLVKVLIVKTENLDDKVKITGTVKANESLVLKSERSGKVIRIYFEEGEKVKKGDLLLQINDVEIKAQIEKQKLHRKLSQAIEARQRKLLEKEVISEEEYENALNKLNTSKADLVLLEVQLEKTKIRAPFTGVIGLRQISIGAIITPRTPIARLCDLSSAKIDFAIPGQYSDKVRKGQKIKFSTDDKHIFIGKVYAKEPQIDAKTQTLNVRALVDNLQETLLPGQFVKVDLILASLDNAILIPSEAVISERNGFKAYIANSGKAKEVKIKIGIRDNRNLQVVSGLQPNDTLIIEGVLKIQSGMDIQIVNMN